MREFLLFSLLIICGAMAATAAMTTGTAMKTATTPARAPISISTWIQSQAQRIEGVLKTGEGHLVSHATVLLKHVSGRVITFNTSDAQGRFTLILPDTVNRSSIYIEVNHLGYARVKLPVGNEQHIYSVVMEEQTIDLEEIDIKSRPRIDARGDTLSYDVGSFAQTEDRTIGEVLRRMPGMEVSESGQIKYNNKAISNFYIDGDDLLADRYAIGTKTIPHAMVQKLEVLQNHQPLKVLRNKSFTDQVAVNLVIREDAKLKMTGQLKLGAGLPRQYDSEINSILFNKKFKMLNVAKGNNTGIDLGSDFSSLGTSDQLSGIGNFKPPALLSPGIGGAPALPKSRYFMNHSGSVNANNLINLRSGLQLRSNLNLLIDANDLESVSGTEVYLGADTIRYTELQRLENNPFLTALNLTATFNAETYYFNNALQLNYRGATASSALQNNTADFEQDLRDRMRDFSNALEYVPRLRNGNILNVAWHLSYYNQPQILSIEEGINADVLNDGVPFAAVQQSAEIPSWVSRISLGYRLPGSGRIRQFYGLTSLSERQQMQSVLRLQQTDGHWDTYAESPGNLLEWWRNELTVAANYEFKSGGFEASLSLPLTAQSIRYGDERFELDTSRARLIFSPVLRTKYALNAEDYLSFSYGVHERTGNISEVYRGVVLTDYRTLRANEAGLRASSGHGGSLHYNFQRSISLLFANAGISFNRSMASSITATVMSNDIARTVLIPFENNVSSFGAHAGVSKYIFALGATGSLKGSWSSSGFNQLINDESLPYITRSWTLTPALEARFWKVLSAGYEATGTWTGSRLAGSGGVPGTGENADPDSDFLQLDRRIRRLDQRLSLGYSPLRLLNLRLESRHQHIHQPGMEDLDYIFIDLRSRYSLRKWRMDIDLDITNLANVKRYETFGITANQFTYGRFQLRSRMAVMKVTFNI